MIMGLSHLDMFPLWIKHAQRIFIVMESMHLFVLIYRVEITRRQSSLMDTELTLFKRGIRKVDSLRPLQRQTMDSMEIFSRVADSCYFDEHGILRFEIKEHRVNEAFLQLVLGENEDFPVSNEEGEGDLDVSLGGGEEGSNDIAGGEGSERDTHPEKVVSPSVDPCEESHC